MGWATTEHAQQFLDVAGPLLRADAASNTVLLTAAASVVAHGPAVFGDEPPLFGWWASADGHVDGAFIHTPPFPAQLTALPGAAVDPLAELLTDSGRPLAGVGAAGREADAFAAAWCARRNQIAELELRLRLYRLVSLHEPEPPPPGHADVATVADAPLVRAWIESTIRRATPCTGASASSPSKTASRCASGRARRPAAVPSARGGPSSRAARSA